LIDVREDFAKAETGVVASIPRAIIQFYRDRAALLTLIILAIILCYLGGAIMFWYHAIYLGEGGPAISAPAHWLLDSTFALVGLTPAIALILPVATRTTRMLAESASMTRMAPWLFAVIVGAMFAAVTAPGPIAHDLIVGRGTWLADRATDLVGTPGAVLSEAPEYPLLAELTLQFGAGVPVYIVLMLLTVPLLRRVLRERADVA
jgi:hypothetical protein